MVYMPRRGPVVVCPLVLPVARQWGELTRTARAKSLDHDDAMSISIVNDENEFFSNGAVGWFIHSPMATHQLYFWRGIR